MSVSEEPGSIAAFSAGKLAPRHARAPRRWPLFYDDFHQVAGLEALARLQAVEDAEALDLVVGRRHPARQLLDRVAATDRENPQPQRPRRLAFRQAHAAEGPDRVAKRAVDLRRHVLGGENEAIDVAAEAHRKQAERPLVAFGGGG